MEQLVLVDEYDNVLGTEEKLLVHQQGLLHRAFSIFIFRKYNNTIQILLQRRNLNKYHSGGLWTNSCCGHPKLNEEIIFAGNRRLQEELGINVELQYIDTFIYKAAFSNSLIEYELDHVLIGLYQEGQIKLNPVEVIEVKWIDLPGLEQKLLRSPQNFTAWLPLALEVIKNNFLDIKWTLFMQ